MSKQLMFDADKHLYTLDDVKIPSVTEILAPLHRSYDAVNPSVLDYAAKRGTAVHEALELYDLGSELEATPETAPYIEAYLEWCNVYRPIWTAVEKPVFCEEMWFAGTLDRMGYLNDGKMAIVDIKTSQPTREAYLSVSLQTMAYAIASTENYSEVDRYGLFLMKNGKYRLLDCKEFEGNNHYDPTELFTKLVVINKSITRLLETKGRRKNGEGKES